jgi:orotidine-5'-phosphate decarboxylase
MHFSRAASSPGEGSVELKGIPHVITALDVEGRDEANELVSRLAGVIDFFKIGSRLFTAEGPAMVKELRASGARIFLDLKFHDIPATVAGSVRAATALGVRMMTLHASGGIEMMRAAAAAAAETAEELGMERPRLVGVTVLTSLSREDVSAVVPFEGRISDLVIRLAENARRAGLDGVVASVEEASLIKERFGEGFIVVTPGIRPAGAETEDQKRVSTPRAAAEAGSDYLVVGRPIIRASSPARAARAILAELKAM